MAERRNWSEDEVRHALALYLVTDFGRIHNRNPDIIKLASQFGRTSNAVALKLANLASLDQSLPRKGMGNVSATDRRVWENFILDPTGVIEAYENKQINRIPAEFEFSSKPQVTSAQDAGFAEKAAVYLHQEDLDKQAIITQRVGQGFFRKMILTSYRGRCALTGIEDKRLLNASHIIAWKDDVQNRVNPSNGICLNVLHDRAFDRHLIMFDEDYRMQIATHVPFIAKRELERVESNKLVMPNRFLPDQAFLEKHRQEFFRKQDQN